MRIEQYIIYGGNNLNDPPRVTSEFPASARVQFERWRDGIRRPESNDVCFVEVPVSSDYRLFVRRYSDDKRFSREVCYYVGLLIGRDVYKDAGEYYVVSCGLASLSLDDILDANLKPITIRRCPCPSTSEWKPFDLLKGTESVGTTEEQFRAKYEEFCFSVSVDNIDDWFEWLAVAVNPSYRYPGINYFVSKKVLKDCPKSASESDVIRHPREVNLLPLLLPLSIFLLFACGALGCFCLNLKRQVEEFEKEVVEHRRIENELMQRNRALAQENEQLRKGNESQVKKAKEKK